MVSNEGSQTPKERALDKLLGIKTPKEQALDNMLGTSRNSRWIDQALEEALGMNNGPYKVCFRNPYLETWESNPLVVMQFGKEQEAIDYARNRNDQLEPALCEYGYFVLDNKGGRVD
ncbi:MAG: hypothetical protein KKE20_01120 [Nanoarchaeota archaeon]|nr:hypothetical protein [Nanoarchaeota archaeon]